MLATGLMDPDVAADLIDRAADVDFPDRLLQLAHDLAGVEEVFAYQIDAGGAPVPLVSSSGLQDASDRTAWYARRFHRSDPAGQARLQAAPGTGFMRRVRAEEIAPTDYRRICFERPRFVEKICYGWRGQSRSLVLSFYSRTSPSEATVSLDVLAQVALTALARTTRSRTPEALADAFEARLSSAFPQLTRREREVTARTLAGWTARRICAELGIGHGTVLTYRQRTYQKLGISRSSDLLAIVTR